MKMSLLGIWQEIQLIAADFLNASSEISPHDGALYCCAGCIKNCS